MDTVVIEPDRAGLNRLTRALEAESDGDEWRAELATDLHAALEPGVAAVRGSLMAMSTGGLDYGEEPLRQAVAESVESDVRIGGKAAGARIRAKRTFGLRDFTNAPKRLNSRRGWKHPVFGRDVWVTQTGRPGWFDDPLKRLRPQLRAAAQRALDKRAQRIGRKA